MRVGLIGAGNIAANRHIPAFKRSGRCELIGIIDCNLDKAHTLCRKAGIANAATTMGEQWFEDVDAVSVAVPPFAHYAVAKEALERGKHVLLEKPMCMKVEEGIELVRIAKMRGLVLAVVHNFQFASSVLRLKNLIAQGKLGTVRNILGFQISNATRRLPAWYEDLPLGLLYDEAPHFLYLLKAFGGALRLETATAVASSVGKVTPAIVSATIQSEKCPCSLYMNFESPVCEWHLMVCGDKALGMIDIFRDILIVLPHDNLHLGYEVMRTSLLAMSRHSLGIIRSGAKRVTGSLLYGNETVVERFFDAIEEAKVPDEISGEDGVAILKLQHELLAKLQEELCSKGKE